MAKAKTRLEEQKLQTDPLTVQQQLAAPFDVDEVKFKPQSVSGNRCAVITFVDARCVMDRLDTVMGMENWRDDYVQLDNGNVLCKLSIRFGDEWITKCDVGGESDQKEADNKCKAAHSDALKRAAVKFGVGRFLYSLPIMWMDYDPQKRQIVGKPQLPDWAIPKKAAAPKPQAVAPPAANGTKTPHVPAEGTLAASYAATN